MSYNAVSITLDPATQEYAEILLALLDIHAFEGIVENHDSYTAYIRSTELENSILQEIAKSLLEIGCSMAWKLEYIPEQNWNKLWESNFEPVIVDDRCVIRAPFHDEFDNIPIRITIEPKMSFGTGHHQTTFLMIRQMLGLDFRGKKVLDMGCGTGVLGILASKLGAAEVCCIDSDRWAYENTLENVARNSSVNIVVIEGDKESLPAGKVDSILANINRNVLIDLMPDFNRITQKDSILMLSGILEEDTNVIRNLAEANGFKLKESRLLDGWMMMLFERN